VVTAAPTSVVTPIPREEPPVPAPAPSIVPAPAPPAVAAPMATVVATPAPTAVVAPAPVVSAVRPRDDAPTEQTAEPRSLGAPHPAPATVASAIVAPRKTTRPATSGMAYWVQVGAFREVKKAMDMAAALRDQAVSLVTTPDQPLMRVLVGPFTDRTAAAQKLREIRARGYEGFIAETLK